MNNNVSFTNKGFLSRNKYKQPNSQQPDHTGKLNIDGADYELAAWIRESQKDGHRYFSLSVKPARDNDRSAPTQADVDSAFPWENQDR
jgi:hypothetical protein